ncbi:MAG: hypothetical protein ACOYK0_01250 [Candidatus Nanopelagicaceae bacterium]
MSNSILVANLNRLITDIKIITGSMSILDQSVAAKDSIAQSTALDAINFRIREIAKLTMNIGILSFPIDNILVELSSPTPNAKILHDLMDTQLDSLRKAALSEILTLSI